MEERTRNLCAQIPANLHVQLREKQEKSGKNLGQYMTWLTTQFYELKKEDIQVWLIVKEQWCSRFLQNCSMG